MSVAFTFFMILKLRALHSHNELIMRALVRLPLYYKTRLVHKQILTETSISGHPRKRDNRALNRGGRLNRGSPKNIIARGSVFR